MKGHNVRGERRGFLTLRTVYETVLIFLGGGKADDFQMKRGQRSAALKTGLFFTFYFEKNKKEPDISRKGSDRAVEGDENVGL